MQNPLLPYAIDQLYETHDGGSHVRVSCTLALAGRVLVLSCLYVAFIFSQSQS